MSADNWATCPRCVRAEAAYAHLASFQRGDTVDVGGRAFFQPGTVTIPQQHDHADINRALPDRHRLRNRDPRVRRHAAVGAAHDHLAG